MKSSPIEALEDNKNDSSRCVKEGGKTDGTSLFERIFGDTHTIYNKKIVNSSDQKQVEAS